MPKIKMRDSRYRGTGSRKMEIYRLLDHPGINILRISQKDAMYHVILSEGSLDLFYGDTNIRKLREVGFNVLEAPEYRCRKTVVIKYVEPEIGNQLIGLWMGNKKAECQGKIKTDNKVHEIENISKIANTTLIKLTYKQMTAATKALKRGIRLCQQFITSANIEREIFASVVPCYKCFRYSHYTVDCPEEEVILLVQNVG